MIHLLIFSLSARLVDIPILEDYPLVWVNVFRDKFLTKQPADIPVASYLELWQCYYENCFQHATTMYELYIFDFLYRVPATDYGIILFMYGLLVLYTSFYVGGFNILFVIASCLLPVVFYYFFVLTDYLEAIEELLAYIRSIDKNRS